VGEFAPPKKEVFSRADCMLEKLGVFKPLKLGVFKPLKLGVWSCSDRLVDDSGVSKLVENIFKDNLWFTVIVVLIKVVKMFERGLELEWRVREIGDRETRGRGGGSAHVKWKMTFKK
jgi:hypothetical protein